MPDERIILFFDGVCNLCNSWVDFLVRRDKRKQFRYAPLQGTTFQGVLAANPELAAYDSRLAVRDQIVVATKIDALDEPDRLASLRAQAEKDGRQFFAISAVTGDGVRDLIQAVAKQVEVHRRERLPRQTSSDELLVGSRW
jgi:GTPase involved in cell partitioning and DNA repair